MNNNNETILQISEVKAFQHGLGLTNTEMASAIGYSETSYSHILYGIRPITRNMSDAVNHLMENIYSAYGGNRAELEQALNILEEIRSRAIAGEYAKKRQ